MSHFELHLLPRVHLGASPSQGGAGGRDRRPRAAGMRLFMLTICEANQAGSPGSSGRSEDDLIYSGVLVSMASVWRS